MKPRHEILVASVIFLFATLALGLLLRWAYAGYSLTSFSLLQLKQAHSHLGVYGVLFPLAWFSLRSLGNWLPGPRTFAAYTGLCALSGFTFLLFGYGSASIVASALILCIWLAFAFFNLGTRDSWLKIVPASIVAGSIWIALIAGFTRLAPDLATQFARAFLATLVFGVFVPVALRSITGYKPRPSLWFAASLTTAVYLADFSNALWLSTGPLWLAFEITRALAHFELNDTRLKALWLATSLGLLFSALNLVDRTYAFGISGIHFLILGPVLLSFAARPLSAHSRSFSRIGYESALIAMCASIYFGFQLVSAVCGTALFLSIIAFMISYTQVPREMRKERLWLARISAAKL